MFWVIQQILWAQEGWEVKFHPAVDSIPSHNQSGSQSYRHGYGSHNLCDSLKDDSSCQGSKEFNGLDSWALSTLQ